MSNMTDAILLESPTGDQNASKSSTLVSEVAEVD